MWSMKLPEIPGKSMAAEPIIPQMKTHQRGISRDSTLGRPERRKEKTNPNAIIPFGLRKLGVAVAKIAPKKKAKRVSG